jgi:ATP-dependent RNA helicase DDX10/DBP4
MFGRKNQDIFSEHYANMVDRDSDSEDGDGNKLMGEHDTDDDDGTKSDDFMTLKRANHELAETLREPTSISITRENLSKRKQRLLKSKKGIAKLTGTLGTKIRFDDEGVGKDAYALPDDEEFRKGGEEAVKDAVRDFASTEREKLQDADVEDKQIAKQKKQEKKRKRKEREATVRATVSRNS